MLTKEQLLAAINQPHDRQPIPVKVPEWGAGAVVYVARVTPNEGDEAELAWNRYCDERGNDDRVGIRAFFVAFAMCDEQGKRLFTRDEELFAVAEKLGNSDGRPVVRIYSAYILHNSIREEDVEQLAKNSEATPTAAGNGGGPGVTDL